MDGTFTPNVVAGLLISGLQLLSEIDTEDNYSFGIYG